MALQGTAAGTVPPNLVLASSEGIPSELGGTSLQVWRENLSPHLGRILLTEFGGMSLQGCLEGCPSKVVWRDVPPRLFGGTSLQGCLEGRPSKVLVLVRKIEITDSIVENLLNCNS